LLDVAWWALTRSWPVYPAATHRDSGTTPTISFRFGGKTKPVAHTTEYDFATQVWPIKSGRPANPGMVLYARVDGSFSVWDPARNYWRDAPSLGVATPDRPAAYHFNAEQVWNGLPSDSKDKPWCNGLLSDWAFWQNGRTDEYQQLEQALLALSPSTDEKLVPGTLIEGIEADDSRNIPTIKTSYGQEVPVVLASAGVKRILAIAYLLVWAWHRHLQASKRMRQEPTRQIVFLLDEVEAHLHPRWQRTVLRSILRVMSELSGVDVEVQVLAITHSPLVLASLEPLFDSNQDALWNLNLENGLISARREMWRRRGDANAWLVSDIFDLREPRSLEAEEAMTQAEEMMRHKQASIDDFHEVREKLRACLPDVDPFWVRFRFWAHEAGLLR
ncbi:MAG TPA: AAA family ATPase, partial [Polyangium sp.]|nr:AAA family ATPase [Polyangium sp.]